MNPVTLDQDPAGFFSIDEIWETATQTWESELRTWSYLTTSVEITNV